MNPANPHSATFANRDITAVRDYWNANPLLGFEFDDIGSNRFFEYLDYVKRSDSDKFAFGYWQFDQFRGRRLLDIGCGPGWLAVQYALGGAEVTAVDLTAAAVDLTRRHAALRSIELEARVANAEELPFPDDYFDVVVSSGVLHHTPDTQTAFREALRVTKPGGNGKITLYRRGMLHSRAIFPMTKMVMRLAGVRHPGATSPRQADTVDEFIRRYDGQDNPVGIAKTDRDWVADLSAAGWEVGGREIHFFPRRFLPFQAWVPEILHALLDRMFGTMAYFDARKLS